MRTFGETSMINAEPLPEFGGGILERKILPGPDLVAMVEYGLLRVNRPPERRQRQYECERGHDGAGSYGDGR
jgi:hypothetical protein